MPSRVRLLAVVVVLCAFCSRTHGPTAPVAPTPKPTAIPAPTATPAPPAFDISGAWNVNGACVGLTSSMWIQQTGSSFRGSYIFHTDSGVWQVDLQGTIAGTSLRGTFSEGIGSYWGPLCGDGGDFQGQAATPNSMSILVLVLTGDKVCCNGPLSITFSR